MGWTCRAGRLKKEVRVIYRNSCVDDYHDDKRRQRFWMREIVAAKKEKGDDGGWQGG
jgi:hypothetical protein